MNRLDAGDRRREGEDYASEQKAEEDGHKPNETQDQRPRELEVTFA